MRESEKGLETDTPEPDLPLGEGGGNEGAQSGENVNNTSKFDYRFLPGVSD
jgi:hypothetical protein